MTQDAHGEWPGFPSPAALWFVVPLCPGSWKWMEMLWSILSWIHFDDNLMKSMEFSPQSYRFQWEYERTLRMVLDVLDLAASVVPKMHCGGPPNDTTRPQSLKSTRPWFFSGISFILFLSGLSHQHPSTINLEENFQNVAASRFLLKLKFDAWILGHRWLLCRFCDMLWHFGSL